MYKKVDCKNLSNPVQHGDLRYPGRRVIKIHVVFRKIRVVVSLNVPKTRTFKINSMLAIRVTVQRWMNIFESLSL